MSKFLKLIVNLFLICAILVAAALLVPPLMGISTTMVDSSSMDSNLPIGSVTYSQEVSVAEISVGDTILVESDTEAYAYIVESADAGDGNYMVTDAGDAQTETQTITLHNVALKVLITIPLIGYVMIAMRSLEGLIIIGLVVVFVIILFILSELWKHADDEDDEDDEDEEDEDKEDEDDDASVKKSNKKNNKKNNKKKRVKKNVDENVDENVNANVNEAVSELADEQEKASDSAASDEMVIDDLLANELARSVAEIQNQTETQKQDAKSADSVNNISVNDIDIVKETETDRTEEQPAEEVQPNLSEAEEVPEDVRNSFVPVARPSKEEILKKADAAKEEPVIIEYEELGITVIDYSDII